MVSSICTGGFVLGKFKYEPVSGKRVVMAVRCNTPSQQRSLLSLHSSSYSEEGYRRRTVVHCRCSGSRSGPVLLGATSVAACTGTWASRYRACCAGSLSRRLLAVFCCSRGIEVCWHLCRFSTCLFRNVLTSAGPARNLPISLRTTMRWEDLDPVRTDPISSCCHLAGTL